MNAHVCNGKIACLTLFPGGYKYFFKASFLRCKTLFRPDAENDKDMACIFATP